MSAETTINEAVSAIEDKKRKLLPIADPMTLLNSDGQGGGITIDMELHKLAKNLRTLTDLEYLAGTEAVRLEKEYNFKTMEKSVELTEAKLAELGTVRSDKFRQIKNMLCEEWAQLEEMRLKHKYFTDMKFTYVEWIQIYKKTRMAGGS